MVAATSISEHRLRPRIGNSVIANAGSVTTISLGNNPQRMISAVYASATPGTFSVGSGGTILAQGEGNSLGLCVSRIEPASGSVAHTWGSTSGSVCAIGVGFGVDQRDIDVAEILEVSSVVTYANMDNRTWPSVTPTRRNQTVLCIYGFSDNTGGPSSEAAFNTASYDGAVWGGLIGHNTLDGNDSQVGMFLFYDPPVGVAFAPQTNTTPTGFSCGLCTVLLDSSDQTGAQLVYATAQSYNGAQTGNWPMPTKAEVDKYAEPGDIFFIANIATQGRYTEFGNATWMDDQYGGNATDGDNAIGWVRLGNDGYLQAWVDSPPTFSYQTTSPTALHYWGVIRGVPRTGSYIGAQRNGTGSFGTTVSPAAYGGANDFVIVGHGVNGSNMGVSTLDNFLLQEASTGNAIVAVVRPGNWTPGTPGSGITITWSTSRTPYWFSVALAEAELTHFSESAVTAPVTVDTVMTAVPGAKFIVSAVTLPVVVDTVVTRTRLRVKKPIRPLVWVHGLDQLRRNVLD